ncbi:hypothetical protein [Niabella hibiscisoli]|uniref:hypothetical protein n=1 Tax=Niabella hibiscisoli TaxID=1825928 RepID=UPI001F10C842|nr:hypothetical protein [Niabella hibiscisoli]MCH5720089.1 hypothetical protein [Niabella hibiscisoli]
MKVWIMQQWTVLFFIVLLCSCKYDASPAKAVSEADSIPAKLPTGRDTIPPARYSSQLSPGKVPLQQTIKDTVTFVERNDNGDYYLCYVRKGKHLVSLIYDEPLAQKLNFLRGDTLEIQWKMDSSWIAGDGDRLEFKEWMLNARKIKDGKVATFRKNYTKPIKYWYAKDTDYSDELKDYLYLLVEYYIAYSKQPLVLLHLEKPEESDFVYSIDDRDEKGRHYIVLGLSNDQGTHSNIIQWLYLDSETHAFYEYDLANDKLIPFP